MVEKEKALIVRLGDIKKKFHLYCIQNNISMNAEIKRLVEKRMEFYEKYEVKK